MNCLYCRVLQIGDLVLAYPVRLGLGSLLRAFVCQAVASGGGAIFNLPAYGSTNFLSSTRTTGSPSSDEWHSLQSPVMLEFESINLAFRLARIARLRRLDNVLVTGNVRFAPCHRACAESENGNKYNEMV